MQAALRLTTQVGPGGKIELADRQLRPGSTVDVIVLFAQPDDDKRRSVLDVLADAPGHLAFQTADEVDRYLAEERDAWER